MTEKATVEKSWLIAVLHLWLPHLSYQMIPDISINPMIVLIMTVVNMKWFKPLHEYMSVKKSLLGFCVELFISKKLKNINVFHLVVITILQSIDMRNKTDLLNWSFTYL